MIFIPVILLIAADQFIKWLIQTSIELYSRFPVIDGFFYIAHTTNKGAVAGILSGFNFVFIPLTIVFSVVIIYLILKNKNIVFRIASVLLLSGALGNFIDRVLRPDGVIDYLEFHFGQFIFPIFNMADSMIVVGSIIIGIYVLFIYKPDKVRNVES